MSRRGCLLSGTIKILLASMFWSMFPQSPVIFAQPLDHVSATKGSPGLDWLESLPVHGEGVRHAWGQPLVISFLLTGEKAEAVTGQLVMDEVKLGGAPLRQSVKLSELHEDMQHLERWEFLVINAPVLSPQSIIEAAGVRQVLIVGRLSIGGRDLLYQKYDDLLVVATEYDHHRDHPAAVSASLFKELLGRAIEHSPECLDVDAFIKINPPDFNYVQACGLSRKRALAHPGGDIDDDGRAPKSSGDVALTEHDYLMTERSRKSLKDDFLSVALDSLFVYTEENLARRLNRNPLLKHKIQVVSEAIDCLGASDFAAGLRDRHDSIAKNAANAD